jgi:hypothetical protein
MPVVLFRLAYLGVTDTFALLRLLPMSDRDKDAEILALRHQITVLQRCLSQFSAAVDTCPARRGLQEHASLWLRLHRSIRR